MYSQLRLLLFILLLCGTSTASAAVDMNLGSRSSYYPYSSYYNRYQPNNRPYSYDSYRYVYESDGYPTYDDYNFYNYSEPNYRRSPYYGGYGGWWGNRHDRERDRGYSAH